MAFTCILSLQTWIILSGACTLSPAVASCNRKSTNNHSFVQLLYVYAPGSCIPNLWRTDVRVAQGLGKQGRGESSWNTQLRPNTYLWVSSTHKLDFSNLAKLRQACRHTSWARTGQSDWARIGRGLGLHSTLFTHYFVLCFLCCLFCSMDKYVKFWEINTIDESQNPATFITGRKVGGHIGRRRIKEDSGEDLWESFPVKDLKEFVLWIFLLLNIIMATFICCSIFLVASLVWLYFSSLFLLMFSFAVLSWPFSSSRSLCESLRSGSLRRKKGATCPDSSNLKEQCSGLVIDWPIQCGYNYHSLLSFTHFFKLSLISPCASQSMPLMWWCPSITYSIFDLSHFIQLNPVEVDSHRQGSLSLLLPLPPLFPFLRFLMFNKMTTQPTIENHFSLSCNMELN